MDAEHRGDILIVDDTPTNLQVLARLLKNDGYKVRPLPSGELGLRAAMSSPPDLVLLDINMPGMDGYEVCTKLRQDPRLADIPVIYISALSEPLDKVRAFNAGGVDYVTKPFQIEEVRARVRTHLRLHRLQLALVKQNRQLAESNERLRELEEMRDNLTHMIVHDMRSPLSGVLASLQFLIEDVLDTLPQESRDDIRLALDSGRRLESMITDLLDINRMEAGKMPLDIREWPASVVVEDALSSLGGLSRECPIEVDCPPVEVHCDREVVRRILVNMLVNAIKFSPAGAPVRVVVAREDGATRVNVIDTGRGIPPEYREKIFEKFGQVEARRNRSPGSSGMGLAYCKLAAETQGGTIGVDSSVGAGSTFWFTIPDQSASDPAQ
jgi:signal transduction histidine kinase